MKKFTHIIMLAFIMVLSGSIGHGNKDEVKPLMIHETQTESIQAGWTSKVLNNYSLTKIESNARNSAVKVEKPDGTGYGSGTYGYYDKQLVVFTANHVVDDNLVMIIHGRNGEAVLGFVVYKDEANDFAVLKVQEMSTRKPIKFKPADNDLNNYIGWDITYTGFPAGYDLLTITGRIAGVRTNGDAVVAHSFTWMGASGSGVFNSKGEYVGPLVAVGLGVFQVTQIVEDMVWIIPATNLDWDAVSEALLPFQ